MEDGELHCVMNTLECPAIQRSWTLVFDKIKDIITFASITPLILATITPLILAISEAIAAIVRNRIYLVAIVVLLLAWVAVYNSRFTYQLSFSIFHIKERIEWSAIFCCLQ